MRIQEVLSAFSIVYENECSVFESQDTIRGLVLIRGRRDLNISKVDFLLRGSVQFKHQKSGSIISSHNHVNTTITQKINRFVKADLADKIKFTIPLPSDLYPSIDSKSITIIYYVQARLYLSHENEELVGFIARGLTIITKVALDALPSNYFAAESWKWENSVGFCPCSNGRILVKLNFERKAFLPGEHIVIKGSINNETGRRVDFAKVILEKVITITKEQNKEEEIVSEEVVLTRDEAVAMFVEPHVTLAISKNFSLPSMRPSTPDGISINHYKIYISYRVNCVIRYNGQEFSGSNIPIIIGTEPHNVTHNVQRECSSTKLIYYKDKTERNVPVGDDSSQCFVSRKNLKYMNMYPYFVHLETSSKQSRRIHKLATAIRAENNFLAKLKAANPRGSETPSMISPSSSSTPTPGPN
uniref:Arrestin_C domain-containing protein n=1 Tax=Bursaphelenchus xylophilus TaxID=6326 RepID=A0A1I7SST8_BURXY